MGFEGVETRAYRGRSCRGVGRLRLWFPTLAAKTKTPDPAPTRPRGLPGAPVPRWGTRPWPDGPDAAAFAEVYRLEGKGPGLKAQHLSGCVEGPEGPCSPRLRTES
jgi:hypothetical protein